MWLINHQTPIPSSVLSFCLEHLSCLSFTFSSLPSQDLPGCVSLAFLQPAKPGYMILSLPAVFSACTHDSPYIYISNEVAPLSTRYLITPNRPMAWYQIPSCFTYSMPIPLSWSSGTFVLVVCLIFLITN